MRSKLITYAITGVGLIGLTLSSKIGEAILPFTASYLFFPAAALTGAGIIMLIISSKSSGSGKIKNKGKEVPIYKGKEVIGYRIVD